MRNEKNALPWQGYCHHNGIIPLIILLKKKRIREKKEKKTPASGNYVIFHLLLFMARFTGLSV